MTPCALHLASIHNILKILSDAPTLFSIIYFTLLWIPVYLEVWETFSVDEGQSQCCPGPPGELALSKSMLYWQIGTKQLVHFFQNGHDSLEGQDKKFHDRTSLFLDQMKHGNFSLKISNVQLGDDAEYSCIYRQTESHQTKKSTIKLNVSGKIFFFFRLRSHLPLLVRQHSLTCKCLGDSPVLYFVLARLAKRAEWRKSNKLGVLVLPH
uniref:Ig-like domain-containing protein n=1 Tax=Zonotrichia albicollis TaxID=44394 RepID=A0A8D2M4S3_ZONAL